MTFFVSWIHNVGGCIPLLPGPENTEWKSYNDIAWFFKILSCLPNVKNSVLFFYLSQSGLIDSISTWAWKNVYINSVMLPPTGRHLHYNWTMKTTQIPAIVCKSSLFWQTSVRLSLFIHRHFTADAISMYFTDFTTSDIKKLTKGRIRKQCGNRCKVKRRHPQLTG